MRTNTQDNTTIHSKNTYLKSFQEWYQEYSFNMWFTVTFPDSPSSSGISGYRSVKKNLGILIETSRKMCGISSVAGMGLIVRNNESKVLHAHCLLWVGDNPDELEEMLYTLRSLSKSQCATDKVYDKGVYEYVFDHHHFTHTTDTDLFTHNDKLLKEIRFTRPPENPAQTRLHEIHLF